MLRKGVFADVADVRQKYLSEGLARYLRTTAEEALSPNIPAREERATLEGMGGIASSTSLMRRTMTECRIGSVRVLYVHAYRGSLWTGVARRHCSHV